MQLGSVGLAVDAPTLGRSLGPWPTARGQPLTGGPRIPLGLCIREKHSSVSTQKEPPWLAPKKPLVGAVGTIGDPVTPSFWFL